MENKTAIINLIDILIRSSVDIQQQKELVNLKEKFNQPEEPQGYQGLNKWYLGTGGVVFAFDNYYNSERVLCYGLNHMNQWCEKEIYHTSNIKRLATPSEIQQAILKGCEQNGIVKGAKVRCLEDGQVFENTIIYYMLTFFCILF